MISIQKSIIISQRGKFKLFASVTNKKRRQELLAKGYSMEFLKSIKALNSWMHTLTKKQYAELKHGSARVANFVLFSR